jgi:hypothetical protein
MFINQGPLNETRPSSSIDAEPPQNVRCGSHRTCMRTVPWQWHLKSPKPEAPRFWYTIILKIATPGRGGFLPNLAHVCRDQAGLTPLIL